MFIGGDIIKVADIFTTDKIGALGEKAFPNLQEASYKLVSASTALDKAIKGLIEQYPDLGILADKLPLVNGQHPYVRIRQAVYLQKCFRYRHIALMHQLS